MEIVPSIEEAVFGEFKGKFERVASFARRVHVDFNDGSFLDFKTVTPEDIAGLIAKAASRLQLEAHLMVQKPYDYILKLKEMGFKTIIVQMEIADDLRRVMEQLQEEDVLIGLSMKPGTSVEELAPFEDFLDLVNVMTVEPGKQNQTFMSDPVLKIRQLRDENFFGEIEVDGGIDDQTVEQVLPFRPDVLVVGHYIAGSEKPQDAYNRLLGLIGSN